MPIGAIAAGVGAAIFVGGTYMEIQQQKKSLNEAKKANTFQRQMSEIQSARQKIDALRAGRQAYAQAQQTAANQGMASSSIGQGGAGSVFSQTMGNLSFLSQYNYFSDQATLHLQRSANAGAKASMWGNIAGAGATVYSASGGFTGPKPPSGKTG